MQTHQGGRMKRKKIILFFWVVALLVISGPVLAADVPRMSVDELKAVLGNDNVIVLDVRSGRDWKSSEFKIQGAKRAEPGKVNTWAGTYPKDKTLVLYCA